MKKLTRLFILIPMFFLGFSSISYAFETENIEKDSEKVFLELWSEIGSLPGPRSDFGIFFRDNLVYLIGGNDKSQFLKSVIYGKLNKDGSIGDWQEQNPLNESRSFFSQVTYKDNIYIIGGAKGPNNEHLLDTVERATINPDGTLGKWTLEKNHTLVKARCKKAVVFNGHIYAVGGWNGTMMTTAERAKINEDGSLGEWVLEKNETNFPRYIHSIALIENRIFVFGGHDVGKGSGIAEVEFAEILGDGSLGKWTKTKPMPDKFFGQSVLYADNKIFLIGGRNGHNLTDSVYSGQLDAETGNISWTKTTDLETNLEETGVFYNDGAIYILGGNNEKGPRKIIYRAYIDKNRVGSWFSKNEVQAIETYNIALDKFSDGNTEEAIELLSKSIELNSRLWDGYYNLGYAYITKSEPDKAITLMNKLIVLNPGYEDAYMLMATAYDKKSDSENVLKYLRLAIETGYGDIQFIINTPDLQHIRKDDRFVDLIKEFSEGMFVY